MCLFIAASPMRSSCWSAGNNSYNPLPHIMKEFLSWKKSITLLRFRGLTVPVGWPHHLQLPEEVQTGEQEKATHTEGRTNPRVDIPH